MIDVKTQAQTDIWARWNWLWHAIFYLAMFISFGFTFRDENLIVPIHLVGIVTGLMFLWHSVGMTLAYRNLVSWEHHPTARFIVLMGDIVLWFILVTISPAYYVTLFGLFIQVFRHLPVRYATITALILTGLMIVEQFIDTGEIISFSNPNSWLFILASGGSIAIAIWIAAIIDQSTQRRELIDRLEATQNELAETQRREGILEERQRLAREIHDTLAQGFTSIVMHLEVAEQALPHDIDTLQRHLNQARSTARSSLGEARRVVQDLRPDLLDGKPLEDAIRRTAQRWQTETDIPISVQVTGDTTSLPSFIEVTLLRAMQEALNNIRKHAHATDVRVTLSYMGDMIMLDIQDNGVGLNGAEPSQFSSGFGLQAMHERVAQCGGTLILESDPDEGTTVTVSVPIKN